ncbi:MAG: Galactose oxidase, central domain, partial [Planctomycetota bacterium]
MPRIASLVLVATSLATALSAQATWTQVSATPAPTAAGGTVGVSDGAGMYVFGGLTSNVGGVFTYSDRLWRFDGINWIDLTPAAGLPPARHFYAACWDIGRQRYVLFGGQNSPSASSTLPD